MQRNPTAIFTGMAMSLAFLLFWLFVTLMSEEIINDDLDQRPTLHIVVPHLYWLTASYVLPTILFCLILAGCFVAARVFTPIYVSLVFLVSLDWLYLALILPGVVLDKVLMAPSKYLSNHLYVLSYHDLQPLVFLNSLLCVIGALMLVFKTAMSSERLHPGQ